MHELAIAQSIVEVCSRHSGGSPVGRVTLEVGTLSAVMPEAIRFCFDVCSQGTALEGSELDVISVPARGRCRTCGLESDMAVVVTACTCGAGFLECISGQRLVVKAMELR